VNIPDPVQRWHTDPIAAARRALAGTDHANIEDWILRRLAEAVHATFDSIVAVDHTSPAWKWDQDERLRAWVRRDLRTKLLDGIVARAVVPIDLPIEETRRYRPSPGSFLGDEEQVIVRLSVCVRTPPVDRVAAVQAGFLYPVAADGVRRPEEPKWRPTGAPRT
jgi:hypothetical protein